MYACKCLNILIQAKNNDVQKVELNLLQLSEKEKFDEFFKKELNGVVAESITKHQQGLVHSRQVGQWQVHRCLNCSMDTHAVHKDKGASCVLIGDNLTCGLTNISEVQKSSNFSKSFGIIINPMESFEDDESKISVTQIPENLHLAYSGLQHQLSEVLRKEVSDTEEKIRRFSEIEYSNLEMFRDQVHREYNTLLRIMLSDKYNNADEVQKLEANTLVPNNDSSLSELEQKQVDTISSLRQTINKPKHPAVTNLVPKTKRILPRQLSHPVQRMESEDGILFPMDGMDESPTNTHSDIDESDTDDSASHDEGIHIPRQRAQSFSIAKSLPMNIPVFMSAFPHEDVDTREDLKTKEDYVDIAASIKALAKSVHGDDVFGDLPRPRFSTQI